MDPTLLHDASEQNVGSRWLKSLTVSYLAHLRRPRGSQSDREKRRDESLQVQAKEPLGTDSHRTISKNSSRCRLLIGHKKCFLLLCPIEEKNLLSSFREFVHDATAIDSITACLGHQTNARSQETFSLM